MPRPKPAPKPYQAAIVQTDQGAKCGPIFAKIYELRLFGGLMKSTGIKCQKNPALVLARRAFADPIHRGAKWMRETVKQIDELKTTDPNKILAVLQKFPDFEEGKVIPKSIHRPTLEQLQGIDEEAEVSP